jgi:hypothetical protein
VNQAAGKSDERQFPREAIAATAVCRTSRSKIAGHVSNLSRGGCCLVTRGQRVAPAQMVTLRLEGLDGIPATVRWVAGDEAGLSFDWPLYEPLRDHIVALRGTLSAGEKAA